MLDLGRRPEPDVDEPGRASQRGQRRAIEPLVVDPFGVGVVERAVLGVEIGQRDPAAGSQQAQDRARAPAVSST